MLPHSERNFDGFAAADTMDRLQRTMVAKFFGTGYSLLRHCEEVGEIAEQIARVMFGDGEEADEKVMLAYLSGSFHDYGKVMIPASVRHSPHRFTGTERKIMEYHTIFGKTLLESEGFRREVLDAALYHHVHFSGGGYPNTDFDRTDIPVTARIVAVADQFSALCENRPYRLAKSPREVWTELRRMRGTVFDPTVFDAFEETQFFKQALSPRAMCA